MIYQDACRWIDKLYLEERVIIMTLNLNSVKTIAIKGYMKVRKISPELALGAGIACGIGSIVVSVMSAKKVEAVIDETQKELDAIEEENPIDIRRQSWKAYNKMVWKIARALAPAIGLEVASIALILLSSLLAATVTAFAGPISFVGIAVPHVIKRALGTSKPLVVIPGAFLGGAIFCLFCDLIARCVFAPTEVSISAVTAIFGAPIVISILLRREKARR